MREMFPNQESYDGFIKFCDVSYPSIVSQLTFSYRVYQRVLIERRPSRCLRVL